jgi:hypothetical protein
LIGVSGHIIVRIVHPDGPYDHDIRQGGIGIIPAGMKHTIVNPETTPAVVYTIYTEKDHLKEDKDNGPAVSLETAPASTAVPTTTSAPAPTLIAPMQSTAAPALTVMPPAAQQVVLNTATTIPTTMSLNPGSLTMQLPIPVTTA